MRKSKVTNQCKVTMSVLTKRITHSKRMATMLRSVQLKVKLKRKQMVSTRRIKKLKMQK